MDKRIMDIIKRKVDKATPEELEEAIKIIDHEQNNPKVQLSKKSLFVIIFCCLVLGFALGMSFVMIFLEVLLR